MPLSAVTPGALLPQPRTKLPTVTAVTAMRERLITMSMTVRGSSAARGVNGVGCGHSRTGECRDARQAKPDGNGADGITDQDLYRRARPNAGPGQQRARTDDRRDEGQLSQFDADVEREQRQRNVAGGQTGGAEGAGETEPVQKA